MQWTMKTTMLATASASRIGLVPSLFLLKWRHEHPVGTTEERADNNQNNIDYRKTDYLNGSIKYDIIFDVAGIENFLTCRRILNNGGIYINSLPRPKILVHKLISVFTRGKRVKTLLQRPRSTDLKVLANLVEEGKLQVIIDSVHKLENVADAHKRAEEYNTDGKIIVKVR